MEHAERAPKPKVLIIDDEPGEQKPLMLELEKYVDAEIASPEEIELGQLEAADLVLADYKLLNWPERDDAPIQDSPLPPIARRPMDGFALIAVLRAHTSDFVRPKAFAMRTGHPQDVSRPLPPDRREHVVARSYNLEWVFAKAGADGFSSVLQIVSLAHAVNKLPDKWPFESPEETLEIVYDLLSFPKDEAWGPRAWKDVEACHPPIHELSAGTHGLAFLRWILHRILPYPCFLWDAQRLAARLRIPQESIRTALNDGGPLAKLLEPFRYRGVLADFASPRWWRSGIETFLWNFTAGSSFDTRTLHATLTERTGLVIESGAYENPVICLNQDLQFLPGLYEARDAVRIQPDDWPPYAEEAWATISSAREEPRLRALVISQDRELLEDT